MTKKNTTFRVDEKMWNNFNKVCQKNGKTRGEVLRNFMKNYINKEDNKMTREELIKKLKGNTIEVDAEWLEENDSELLDWITSSKYWGRGVDDRPDREKAVVRILFDEGGVAYIATHDSEGVDVKQSLNNQPYWGEDEWEDWGDIQQLKTYYEKLQGN